MATLPKYAKRAFMNGRGDVFSIKDNPYRRLGQRDRVFRLVYKGYDLDAGDFDENGEYCWGTPFVYEIAEVGIVNWYEDEVVIDNFTFKTWE